MIIMRFFIPVLLKVGAREMYISSIKTIDKESYLEV